MIDRLRVLWNRPLRDGDRPRLFAITVVLVAGVASLLALIERPEPTRPKERPREPVRPALATATPTSSSEPAGPTPEGTRPSVPVSRTDVAASRRASRSFLAGYLPYTYGSGSVSGIRAATSELRDRLTASRPHVPARERKRTPRLVLLQSDRVGRDDAEFVALVSDGARRYTVALGLTRTGAGWRVARVGS